jgi:hypothetical protein
VDDANDIDLSRRELRGQRSLIRSEFIPDFVGWGKSFVELKLGFLVNFGQAHGVKLERIIK